MPEATAYIGVDITAGKRPATLAVLDEHLRIVELADLPFAEVVTHIEAFPRAVCAIDASSGVNAGLMASPDYRTRLNLEAGKRRYHTYRVCEFELRRRGIGIYNTPVDSAQAKGWMQEGWRLYNALRHRGFVLYPEDGHRRMFETHPHGVFTALIRKIPYAKSTLEGRLQRQAILFEQGVDVTDPMDIIDEWTRYHLMNGQIDLAEVLTHDRLDALAAAYTAWMVGREPERTCALGDLREGQIVLPVARLLDSYTA
ncbi:MAG: DUF429 domain-containing protein [Anaerolineae bacterium]|nr:DUF429 domain-containing protein [Anaerolineae bacterium]